MSKKRFEASGGRFYFNACIATPLVNLHNVHFSSEALLNVCETARDIDVIADVVSGDDPYLVTEEIAFGHTISSWLDESGRVFVRGYTNIQLLPTICGYALAVRGVPKKSQQMLARMASGEEKEIVDVSEFSLSALVLVEQHSDPSVGTLQFDQANVAHLN